MTAGHVHMQHLQVTLPTRPTLSSELTSKNLLQDNIPAIQYQMHRHLYSIFFHACAYWPLHKPKLRWLSLEFGLYPMIITDLCSVSLWQYMSKNQLILTTYLFLWSLCMNQCLFLCIYNVCTW